MPAQAEVRVEGLESLRRAFRFAGTGIDKDLRAALQSSAEPVRSAAESLASSSIRRIGIPWSRMRVGVTRSTVYVAPVERGTRKPRSAASHRAAQLFAGKLLDRAMEPALDANVARVEREVIDTLNDLARAWSRVP